MAKTTTKETKTLKIDGYDPISLKLTTGRLMKAQEKDYDIEDVENGILGTMFMSPTRLAKGVWILYGDRINAAGVDTEEDFYDLLDDEVNKALDECMKNAVRDFFTWGPEYVKQVENLLNNLGKEMEEATAETNAPSGTRSSSAQG